MVISSMPIIGNGVHLQRGDISIPLPPVVWIRVKYFKGDQINRIMSCLVCTCRELNGKSGTKNENKAKEKASVLTPAPSWMPVSRNVPSKHFRPFRADWRLEFSSRRQKSGSFLLLRSGSIAFLTRYKNRWMAKLSNFLGALHEGFLSLSECRLFWLH